MTSSEGQVQMASSETLSLPLLAERIANEHTARLTSEKSVEKALALQAQEYERRLDALNHAHQQAIEAQAMTVPRETFEAYIKEAKTALDVALKNLNDRIEARKGEVDRRLSILEDAYANTTGRATGSAQTVRWALAALTAIATAVGLYVLTTR